MEDINLRAKHKQKVAYEEMVFGLAKYVQRRDPRYKVWVAAKEASSAIQGICRIVNLKTLPVRMSGQWLSISVSTGTSRLPMCTRIRRPWHG